MSAAALMGVLGWLPATAAFGAEDTCGDSASSEWTRSERWIWSQVCKSQDADLNSLGGPPAPASTQASGWSESHRISADFLRDIVTEPQYVRYTSVLQVRVSGALVRGYLDLSDMISARGLAVEDSRFQGVVSLYNAMTTSDVNFSGSTFLDEFRAAGAKIGGTFYLDEVRAEKSVNLEFAKIAETLSIRSTVILGDFEGNDLQVDRDCTLVSDAVAGIRITDATIGGTLSLYSTSATDEVDLSGSASKDLIISGGSYEKVGMTSADVEHDAVIEGATMPELEVYGSRIGGALSLAGTHLEDQLTLTNSTVGGPLHLVDSRSFTFDPSTTMDLRNLAVGSVDESPATWPTSLRLNGFSYRGTGGTFVIDRDLDFYRQWLERDQYNRGPYRNLEDALREAGRTNEADAVAMMRMDREAEEGSWLRWPDRFLFKASVGYGYKPWYAIAPIIVLIVFGSVVAKHLALDRHEVPSTVLLSAHLLVPLISFGERFSKVDVTSGNVPPFVRRYFYVHVVVGYVLAAYVAAALARITSR